MHGNRSGKIIFFFGVDEHLIQTAEQSAELLMTNAFGIARIETSEPTTIRRRLACLYFYLSIKSGR